MKTILILLLMTSVTQAQYRNDMPEVSQPVSDARTLESDQCEDKHYIEPMNRNLTDKYLSAGQPRILILLGRTLGSNLSEWQADTRDTISVMNRAYQGTNQSKDTRDTYRMSEKRRVINLNVTTGMRAFYKGFTEYMQASKIGMVSYDSILRQAQRKNELSGSIDRSTDKLEVEADAIFQYVDVLVEILDAGSINVLGKRVDRVQVKVTRLDTFETVSQHTGSGEEYYKIDEQWVTDSDGYEKLRTVLLHHADVGYQKAQELLSIALNRPYSKKSLANMGQNNPDKINKPKIKKKKRVLPPGN